MRAVVFGTAGHIDHGKTALVKALTGVDCDRLPEETRRGITLVLGFAPLADPLGELELSFVDVPGHERLVHTMIAGAAGIDRALLVVAADEGMMPQTREHLDVLEVLGVRGGVVALTKADAVEPARLDAVRAEVAAAVAGGPLDGAAMIACSALRGDGIAAVRDAVLACGRAVARRPDPNRPFRLSVDRAFTVAGAGTVVTGTATWGWVRTGDELVALPGAVRVRVRGLQVHGATRAEAEVGERIALSLAGATVSEMPRGEELLAAGPWRTSARLALDVRVLRGAPPLAEGERVWLHLHAARRMARVERAHPATIAPQKTGRVIVRLARAVFAVPGDKVVLRRVSPAAPIGGGEVLDVQPERVGRRDSHRLAELVRPSADPAAAIERWVRAAGVRGLTAKEIGLRLGVDEGGVESVIGRVLTGGSVAVAQVRPPALLHRDVLAGVQAAAEGAVRAAGGSGVPRAELVAQLVPPAARHLREFYLDLVRRSGVVREVAGRMLPADAAPLEDALAARLAEFYRNARFDAPSPEEAAAALGADPKASAGLVRFLVEQKRLARVGGKWVLHRQCLDEIVASLREWGVESFDVAAFKDRFGLTRKLAIPILEWLDSERVTRREGDRRRLLRPRAGSTPSA